MLGIVHIICMRNQRCSCYWSMRKKRLAVSWLHLETSLQNWRSRKKEHIRKLQDIKWSNLNNFMSWYLRTFHISYIYIYIYIRYPAEVHTWFFSYPAGGPGMGGVNNAAGVAGMPNDHSQQSSSAVVSNSSSSRNNHYTRIRDLW